MESDVTKIMQECLNKLSEHCDSARIFVTIHDGLKDVTRAHTLGCGNFYSQLGQVTEWKGKMDEIVREEQRPK